VVPQEESRLTFQPFKFTSDLPVWETAVYSPIYSHGWTVAVRYDVPCARGVYTLEIACGRGSNLIARKR
jgi:hypothetical protein